eukprot:SAG11_NODE_37023_length_258_cov_3.207547_1_plen_54_part_10
MEGGKSHQFTDPQHHYVRQGPLSELASRVGEEMIVKRVYSVYGQYTQKTQNFVP